MILLRRLPAPPREPPPHHPAVLRLLQEEIRRSGPITFARFMEIALYAPRVGYYRRPESANPTADYLTAPETHPLFGRTLARTVAEVWRRMGSPPDFTLIDEGAGAGGLAVALLDELRRLEPRLYAGLTYRPREIAAARRRRLRERLRQVGLDDRLVAPGRGGSGARPSGPARWGMVVANEFLDAFPVHRVLWRGGRLWEIYVDVDQAGELRERLGPPSTPALADRLAGEGVQLAEEQEAEVSLALDRWAAGLRRRLRMGALLVIDYGDEAAALYGPRRRRGTLQTYLGQRTGWGPLVAVGRQDLTAHVDFTALARALAASGWTVVGLTSQAEFLAGSGLEEAAAQARQEARDLPDLLHLRSALGRFLDPRHTGGFRVLVASRGVPGLEELPGLRYRLLRP
jgi:SAM-dependent MidA family methyltransferase